MQTLSNRRVSNSLNALNAGTPRPHLELTVIDDWTWQWVSCAIYWRETLRQKSWTGDNPLKAQEQDMNAFSSYNWLRGFQRTGQLRIPIPQRKITFDQDTSSRSEVWPEKKLGKSKFLETSKASFNSPKAEFLCLGGKDTGSYVCENRKTASS